MYLSLLISFVTVGLTVSLFLLTVIGWFPDLYSTSKYIGQAYVLFTNMVALMTAGFVVLSTFVPSVSACNTVLILVHFTIFLFLTSEFLVHLDFYTAIVLPFWHEEKVASNENAATFICLLSIIGSIAATGGLFFHGNLMCPEDRPCTIVPIINMTLDKSTSSIVLVMTVSLFGIVFLSCCHIFLIALQKLRANVVVAPAGSSANNLSGTSKRFMVKNGDGMLVYEDDMVSKEVKSAARAPFADPMFLHAIGSTFLQRVAKNTEQPEQDDLHDVIMNQVNLEKKHYYLIFSLHHSMKKRNKLLEVVRIALQLALQFPMDTFPMETYKMVNQDTLLSNLLLKKFVAMKSL